MKIRKMFLFMLGMTFILGGCSTTKNSTDSEVGSVDSKKIQLEIDNIQLPKEVKNSLDLPFVLNYLELEIKWISDNNEIIDGLGNVYLTQTNQTVNISAVVSYQDMDFKKDFVITVAKNSEDFYTGFDAVYGQLEAVIPNSIRKDIPLMYSLGEYPDTTVKYSSSKNSILTGSGMLLLRDPFEDKKVNLYTKIEYKEFNKTYVKEINVQKLSPYDKMPHVKKYVEDYIKENNIYEISQLPLRYEPYDLDIKWKCTTGEVVNMDGTFNKTVEPLKTKVTAELKIDFLVEKVNFDYTSKEMNQTEKEVYLKNLFDRTYGKESYAYLPIVNLKDVLIKQGMVDINAPNRSGRKMPVPSQKRLNAAGYDVVPNPDNIIWIVIHDTGNPGATATAELHNRFINDNPSTGVSWQYTVDDKEIYQHIPDNEIAYHAGDGTKEAGNGNSNGIGIETCINLGGDYELTLKHTAKLVAMLLNKHNLKMTSIQQHFYFSGKDCPRVLRTAGRWNEFLEMVRVEYHTLNILKSADKLKVTYGDIADVYKSPLDVLKASLNEVSFVLKIEVTLSNLKNEFTYNIKMKK